MTGGFPTGISGGFDRNTHRVESLLDFNQIYALMLERDLSGALRTVLNILDAWDVTPRDRMAILGCDQDMYDRWIKTHELGETHEDTLERLSYVLGIWKALQILFPDQAAANTWIHRSNNSPVFNGKTPLSIMVKGRIEDLSLVRIFLDSWYN